jgi:hypothetical protein
MCIGHRVTALNDPIHDLLTLEPGPQHRAIPLSTLSTDEAIKEETIKIKAKDLSSFSIGKNS